MATRSAQAKKATAKTTAALSESPKATASTKPSKGPKRSTTTRQPSSLSTRQLALLGRLRAGTARPGEVKAQSVSVLAAFMAVILGARVATHALNPRHIYRVPTITTEALGVDLDTARAIRRELGRAGVLKSNGRGVNAASTLTLPDLYQGYLEQTTPPASPGPRQARVTELTGAEVDLLRRLYLGESVWTEVTGLENRTLAAFTGVVFALQVNAGELDPQAADRLRARTRDFLGIDLHRADAICRMLERDGVILPQGKIGGRRSPAVLNLPALYLQYADMLHAELASTPAAVLSPGLAISLTPGGNLEPSLPPEVLRFDPEIARNGIHLTGIADERWVVELILKEGVGRAGHLAYLILQAIQMGSVTHNA